MKRIATYALELVGESIRILKASNSSLEGLEGKIIDEHKETLTVQITPTIQKTLLKQAITFKLLSSGKVLEGKTLRKRPEERIKG